MRYIRPRRKTNAKDITCYGYGCRSSCLSSVRVRAVAIFEEMIRRHPDLGGGIRRTLERRIRLARHLMARSRRSFSGRCMSPAGWACRISPTWAMLGITIAGEPRWITGSITSGSPIPASSMPMSCSAARASWPWRKGCRTPCGRSAAHRAASHRQPLGGVPQSRRACRGDLTRRYDALCAHYGMTPTRNNRGVAHENGAIEGPHGHLKRAIQDALLMRGSARFRRSRRLSRLHRRDRQPPQRPQSPSASTSNAPTLQPLPDQRTSDYEEVSVPVTSSGGFTLRKVFYTVPSRLIGHRLRVRLYDDRLDLFIGGTPLMTLTRGAPSCLRQARPGRRLSPCHPFAAPQADGAAQPRLSRPAVPARRLSGEPSTRS